LTGQRFFGATPRNLVPIAEVYMTTFNDQCLQEALESVDRHMQSQESRLNAISSDIKKFEALLQDRGWHRSCFFVIAENLTKVLSTEYEESNWFIGGESVEGEGEYLVIGSPRSKPRLRYVRCRLEGFFQAEQPIPEWCLSLFELDRPLIECPVPIRLAMHSHLPRLLKVIAAEIAGDPRLFADEEPDSLSFDAPPPF
jgi:hypothetical protein